MTILQTLLLGLVQGITEFLPVSSSGHLLLTEKLLGMQNHTGIFLNVMLHLGTLLVIVLTFSKDIRRILAEGIGICQDIRKNIKIFGQNLRSGEERRFCKLLHNNYRKFFALLFLSNVITVAIGILVEASVIAVSKSILTVGIGMYTTGVLMIVADFKKDGEKLPRETSWPMAVLLGVCQGFALYPGISNIGVVIAVCLLCGFNRKFAVKYAFIASIPATVGAVIWELRRIPSFSFDIQGFIGGILGILLAGVVGYFCAPKLVKVLWTKRLGYFAGYCFFVGTVVLIGHFIL